MKTKITNYLFLPVLITGIIILGLAFLVKGNTMPQTDNKSFVSQRAPFTFVYPITVKVTPISNSSLYRSSQTTLLENISLVSTETNGEPGNILGYVSAERYIPNAYQTEKDKILKEYRDNLNPNWPRPDPVITDIYINGILAQKVVDPTEPGVYTAGADIRYYFYRNGLRYIVGITAKKTENQKIMTDILQTFQSTY